VSSKKLLINNI